MRVLVAPQEFKGSLSAVEAAQAIAAGLRAARPEWELDLLPMSDGGPGFLEAMRAGTRGDMVAMVAHDAIGRKVLARYVVLREPRTGVIEAAQANGLFHLKEQELDPLHADTFGVGEIIREVAAPGLPRIIVGVGGSATTDGGAGMARALGARLLGMDGRELEPGGAALAGLERIEWAFPESLRDTEIVVATDVTNPLTGPNGAAAVYGPQKGATPADVDMLDAALVRYAAVVRRALGVDMERLEGAGAAGGLAGGLVAFLGAKVESGFEVVAGVSRLAERLSRSDLVVTGEGSFDSQSLQGKTAGRLIGLARAAGKPIAILAGTSPHGAGAGLDVRTLTDLEPERSVSMKRAAELLKRVAYAFAAGRTPLP